MSVKSFDAEFCELEAAAIAGKRCPQSWPHGPLRSGSVSALVELGRIRSEVYAKNWRVVTILEGPHKGKSTESPPSLGVPYLINGRRPGRPDRTRPSTVPITLAKTTFGR